MRFLIMIAGCFSLFGCNQQIDTNKIFGSWSTVGKRRNTPDEIVDSSVFVKSGILKTYFINGGKIKDSTFGRFEIKGHQLSITHADSTFNFNITGLNKKVMVWQQTGKTTTMKFYRLD